MKKIAYIELDTHAEILMNFMALMADSKSFEVDYFISEKINKQIHFCAKNIHITSKKHLLHQLKKKNYDLVIIGTAHRNFNLYKKVLQYFNSAIITHNLNFSKIGLPLLFKNIFVKEPIYRLKLVLKEGLFSLPMVYKNAKHLLVLDHNIVQPPFIFLPLFYNQFHQQNHFNSSIFEVVIPGSVSQKRRDYKHIIKKIRAFNTDLFPNIKIKFVFLGKAEGQELKWLQTLKKELKPSIELQFFTEKVAHSIFEVHMQKAHLLWCPLKEETYFFSQKEIYAKTKITGNLGDAIKFGKCAIFPQNYPSDYDFIFPENENLEQQFLEISKQHYDFQKTFSKEKISEDLEKTLMNLI